MIHDVIMTSNMESEIRSTLRMHTQDNYLSNLGSPNRPSPSVLTKYGLQKVSNTLRTRIGEHRQHFYQIIKGDKFDLENNNFALGHHLNKHGFNDRKDFNKVFNVCILEKCSPKVLDVKEHKYIHQLNSLTPQGINLSNPFIYCINS